MHLKSRRFGAIFRKTEPIDVYHCDLLAFGAVLLGRACEARAVLAHLGVVARVGGVALDRGTHLLSVFSNALISLHRAFATFTALTCVRRNTLAIETTEQMQAREEKSAWCLCCWSKVADFGGNLCFHGHGSVTSVRHLGCSVAVRCFSGGGGCGLGSRGGVGRGGHACAGYHSERSQNVGRRC